MCKGGYGMYTVKFKKWADDGSSSYEHLHDGETCWAKSVTLNQEIGSADTLDIEIYPENPAWGSLVPIKCGIQLLKDGEVVGQFRVISLEKSMDENGVFVQRATCEHWVMRLNDCVVINAGDVTFTTTSSSTAIKQACGYLASIMKNAGIGVSFWMDVTTNLAPSEITVSWSGKTCWACFSELVSDYGGEWYAESTSESDVALHYAGRVSRGGGSASPANNAIAIADNMRSMTVSCDGTDFYNALIPYGADGFNDLSSEAGEYSTYVVEKVTTAPGTTNWCVRWTADARRGSDTYGKVIKTHTWPSIDNAANLIATALIYITSYGAEVDQIDVSAYDLSVDGSLDAIEVGYYYPITNARLGYSGTVTRCVKRTLDVLSPWCSTFAFNATGRSWTK